MLGSGTRSQLSKTDKGVIQIACIRVARLFADVFFCAKFTEDKLTHEAN